MSLLLQIQDAASDPNIRLADLLRKCKILAYRLQSEALREWVNKELDGYGKDDELPDYRIMAQVEARGHFSGWGGSMVQNALIPLGNLPKELRAMVEDFPIRGGVMMYEDLLRSDETTFRFNWPGGTMQAFEVRVFENYQCLEAWTSIPRGSLVRLMDSVRNKILEFALEIYNENPDAGEAEPNTVPVPPAAVHHIYQNTIHTAGNVAMGSHDVTQNALIQSSWSQLSGQFDIRVLATELAQVRKAMNAQDDEPDHFPEVAAVTSAEMAAKQNDGPKMLEHLKDFGKWGFGVANTVGAGTLLALVKQHFGLH